MTKKSPTESDTFRSNTIEIGGIYRTSAYRSTASHPVRAEGLVLVTGVDETASNCIAVTLLSPDIEFGTNTDLTLSGCEFGRGYDLLAQSDIFTYLAADQIGRQIGRVTADFLDDLAALRDDHAVNRPVAGPPVLRRDDPRWDFKVRELRRLQNLAGGGVR